MGRARLAARGAVAVAVLLHCAARSAAQAPDVGMPVATPLGDAALRFGGEVRARAEGLTPSQEDDDFNTQALTAPDLRLWRRRVRVWGEVDLHRLATVLVEWQHAVTWSGDPLVAAELDRVDLRQAWVALRPPAWPGLTLRVGRFEVPTVGDGRVFSTNDWDDVGRSLDGVQATFGRGAVRWTVLAANVTEADPVPAVPGQGPDHWLGAVIVEARPWNWLDVDWVHVERWFPREFGSEDPTDTRRGPRLDATLGARVKARLGPLAFTVEAYGQGGVHGPDRVAAGATAERVEWRVRPLPLAPTLFFEHAWASGDRRPTDGVRGTFDPLFPDTHAQLGPYDALGWRNVNALATGITLHLTPLARAFGDWRLIFVARGSFLDRWRDAWYGADGRARLVDPSGDGASSHTLEGELSGVLEGTLFEGRLAVSLGFAHWCPNNFLNDSGFHDHGYRAWAQTTVRF